MKNIKCTRCDVAMSFMGTEQIQLGKTSFIFGDWSNLLSGALDVGIYACPECGKLEFFQTEKTIEPDTLPQTTCPECGKTHDFDYPKCPFCAHKY